MTLDRKQAVELYEGAACQGEVSLFASTSRNAFTIAAARCAECPVADLCLQHVNPAEDGFTGTCAGRLWFDGTDVTDDPSAAAPPVFRLEEVDVMVLSALLDGECTEWGGHSDSTVMSACWGMRSRFTLNRVGKRSGMARERVQQMILAFEDGAPLYFRDFVESMAPAKAVV